MPRKGLGKGLDSLIPNFYDEDFDSNSPMSLEDMLNEGEETSPEVEETSSEEPVQEKNIFEEVEKEAKEESEKEEEASEEKPQKEDGSDEKIEEENVPEEVEVVEEVPEPTETEDVVEEDEVDEEIVESTPKILVNEAHVDDVKEIVNKNPRITLWSSRSSAVLRYLRKTEPEFSISKEASSLIEEAISKKYPEIWELFDDV